MPRLRTASVCAAVLLSVISTRLVAIQLTPVATGLANPVFVGNAGDSSNRLFIVQQGGQVLVLQPGASTPTTFLDIQAKVVAGGERGLLGLAFHPQYAGNGRFFVYYTRAADGTIVIAEYHVSANKDVADPTTERVLLTIPHPNADNHNGGMMAFGPDGYLYIGVGDGGGANDPPSNAQNINVLLGKILRIDINAPPGVPYLSPATNPFFGATAGSDEIFAYGMRNPWRFSFDRATHVQWVGDVGQDTFEEVDTPIVNGGNYGWRVFEGQICTNNDTTLCGNSGNYIFPIFTYAHTLGRCSIIGGYVYRGSQGALPAGTYIYGDFCSGEIFGWNGSSQNVLLASQINIMSFGEDEAGELYVAGLAGTVGTVQKFAGTAPCTYSINPTSASFGAAAATGSVSVTAGAGCAWTATSSASWITITAGSSGSGIGAVNYSVAAYTGKPKKRSGTMTVAGKTFTVKQTR